MSSSSNFNTSLSARTQFIQQFSNNDFEPFYDEYIEHMMALNAIVQSTGESLEGNIFYEHLETNLGRHLAGHFLPKRRTFAMSALMFNNIMEIGFNAGHSALLLLTANPALKLTSIDICQHKYTKLSFDYLKGVFGDRINLIDSNSTFAFPLLARQQTEYDLYIIDGGHGIDVAETDLYNTIKFSKKGSVICFDDSNNLQLRVLLDMYLLTGQIISISDPQGHLHNYSQMFFINNKTE